MIISKAFLDDPFVLSETSEIAPCCCLENDLLMLDKNSGFRPDLFPVFLAGIKKEDVPLGSSFFRLQ